MTELIIINKNVWKSKQRYNFYPIFPLHLTPIHSTYLFKIFFSLLTLSLFFCKKLVDWEKMFSFRILFCQNLTVAFLFIIHLQIRVISFLRINSNILRLKSRNVRIRIISQRKVLITQCGKLSSMNTLCSTLSIRYFFSNFFLHLSLANSYMTAYMLVYIL